VETWHLVDLKQIADELPLQYLGVPLTYMSVNDLESADQARLFRTLILVFKSRTGDLI